MNKSLIDKIAVAIRNNAHDSTTSLHISLIYQAGAVINAIKSAGYAVVPVEPTEKMLEAGQDCFEGCHHDNCPKASKHIWGDMIKAAEQD